MSSDVNAVMRTIRVVCVVGVAVCLAFLAQHTSAAASTTGAYRVTDLGSLPGSFCSGFAGGSSFATALNDLGHAAGGSCVLAGFFQPVTHAFIWRDPVMTDMGTFGSGNDRQPDQSVAIGMNDIDQVVGRNFLFSETGGDAFLWSNGSMVSLAPALGGFSSAMDINNAGQVVGLLGDPANIASWSAFLYDAGTHEVSSLPGLGGSFRSEGRAINEAGQVAGYATTSGNAFHAVRWDRRVPVDLGTLGGTHSFGNAINASGDVVGTSYLSGDTSQHAFLWRNGQMSDLGALGGSSSSAYAISDRGVVVGSSTTAASASHAFIYRQRLEDLNDLIPSDSGWVLMDARAINSSGQIAGIGTVSGVQHAFLLTPVDTSPPALAVPADVSVNATGPGGAVVSYAVTASDDSDPNPAVTCAPLSGSTFAIGTTTVNCEATDAAGNNASASFTVHVKGAAEQLDDLLVAVTGIGPGGSLADKVRDVESALARDDVAKTCELLNAFVNQVSAQSGRTLTAEQASDLVARGERIRVVLAC